VSRVKLMI